MNSRFFLRLALTNLRKNARMFVPYLLTCILSVSMYYVICSLAANPDLMNMFGGVQMQALLGFGTYVVALFVIIFLFYTNSFLMKRRKKEFGVFNILGMEKRHIVYVIACETVLSAGLALIGGIGLGIGIERVLYALLSMMAQGTLPLGVYIGIGSIRSTCLLFVVIFVLIFLNSIRQIHLADPIELLHGSSVGEREPKTKWLMTLLGFLTLGAGYGIAVTVKNPLDAFLLFFLAVVLVIIGTYLLFTSGSITLLKLMKKNKRFYYRTSPFINVSTMIYRMKQNAVGLANICILSTMVLVMLSTTTALYAGMDETVQNRYPREIDITMTDASAAQRQQVRQTAAEVSGQLGLQQVNVLDYSYLCFSALREDAVFLTDTSLGNMSNMGDIVNLFFISLEDYNRNADADRQLAPGEVLLYVNQGSYEEDTLEVLDERFVIKERLAEFVGNASMSSVVVTSYFIVVEDEQVIEELFARQQAAYGDQASEIQSFLAFDTDGNADQNQALYEQLSEQIVIPEISSYVESRTVSYGSYFAMYAGFLFIGVFLSILFLMATILILYYKQISEGYEDRRRFEIMQKVGMDHREVRRVIRSQVLMVFFLPLAMSALHITFAFPIVSKLLAVLSLMNTSLFVTTTLLCFGGFTIIYCILYLLTSRVYYSIVKRTV